MAVQDLQEKATQDRVLIMMGAEDRVFTKQFKRDTTLRWLKDYDAQRVGGNGMRKSTMEAYDAVRKQAANERGTRRGVKGLFEKQRQQHEAQARKKADRREEHEGADGVGDMAEVDAGVSCDRAEGGLQTAVRMG